MRYKIRTRNRRKGRSMMRKSAVNGLNPSPRQISGDPTDHPVYTPITQPVVKRKKKDF